MLAVGRDVVRQDAGLPEEVEVAADAVRFGDPLADLLALGDELERCRLRKPEVGVRLRQDQMPAVLIALDKNRLDHLRFPFRSGLR